MQNRKKMPDIRLINVAGREISFPQTLLTESAKRKILARQIFYAADFKPRPKIKIKPTRKHRIEAIKILPSKHYPNTSVIKNVRRP